LAPLHATVLALIHAF